MRITTTMLNLTSKKTGIPIGSSSMLDYINQNNNDLLSVISNKKTNAYDTVQKKSYEKLGAAAESLFKSTEGFLAEDEKNLLTKAKETGDYKDVYDEIASLAEHYNNTLSILKGTSGALNNYYSIMLSEAASESKDQLAEVGMNIGKDGKVSIDTEKLRGVDKEQLEKVFGKDSDFMKKLAFLSDRISDNAQSYANSISNQYNAAGNTYSASTSKYDFLG
ncbi:MAG: hypothetical protein K2L07_05450 [Lachnospiraceae bacterium]|nr:hypothetical protein [Lachnospiraceae bacterium]